MDTFFYLAVMLFGGLLFGKLAKFVHLPNVTGYLIGGLLLGPSVLGILPADLLQRTALISDMALGFIAFSIGSEFKIDYFKKAGYMSIVIAIFEALFAVFFVMGAMLILRFDTPFALVLGAIASATAPAATIMVVRQYRAKGPVTDTLLRVVALDDAVALIAFGFAVAIANSMLHNDGSSLLLAILAPVWEVVKSVGMGAALGLLFAYLLRFFSSRGNRLSLTIAFVFVTIGISRLIGGSDLLSCMAMGSVFVNVTKQSNEIMSLSDVITPPIFMLFFLLSGADLDLSVIPSIGLVGVTYVVMRVVGKFVGSYVSAKITHAPSTVQKYLGFTLMPQAGVAIGLSLVAEKVIPTHAAAVRTVVLCATLIYELIGPVIVKAALIKAGEIRTDKKQA